MNEYLKFCVHMTLCALGLIGVALMIPTIVYH